MEKMINNQMHKKLTKKFTKGQTSSPTCRTNLKQVLIEKTEQHNWALLIACKICKKKCSGLGANYIKSISYGRTNMNKNTPRYPTNFSDRSVISIHKCHSSHLFFQIIMEIQVHGNRTTILEMISQLVMTLFSVPSIGAGF